MANLITLNANLTFANAFDSFQHAVADKEVTPAAGKSYRGVQNIGITEEAILFGDLTSIGWTMFRNLDPTNYIELRVGTGGAKFATLHPDTNADGTGGFAVLYLGSGAQVPYAISNTGTCDMLVTACAP